MSDSSNSAAIAQNDLLGAVPNKPRAGVWGNDDFWRAYVDLLTELQQLIPADTSHGALALHGVAAMARAKCKAVVAKARIMEDKMKAVTAGRR